MKKLLAIIDMQGYFSAAHDPKTIAGCQFEIARAMSLNHPIVLVKYKGCGPILPSILNPINGYPFCWTIVKDTDDGSSHIKNFVKKNNLFTKVIRVAGVNADACVLLTVEGLLELNFDVEVCKYACNSISSFSEINEAYMDMRDGGASLLNDLN